MTRKLTLLIAAAAFVVPLSGCGGSAKDYDIGPIFPLTSGKCAKYHGDEKGSGIMASCMVTKSECEKAVADWRAAMVNVSDAIEFRC